ncbi:hypothetical protein QBC40DRAFT_265859 [Triangularia verruculosa]|uniref:Heterokaryon incompatibility domain-containing protein n=1 Tax=Triangularia verruculosa TaxID=2587418 RepID=A0AAN6XEZ7_9PEZI|nr:hypothetical protein QBC40DRAFT_265859 [Triangularia verruculosa]
MNERDIYFGTGIGDTPVPTKLVSFPFENISEHAVLSWRWDGDLKTWGSKNIALALHQAKRMGVRYQLMDLVSVDQTLSGEALIQQVVAFSSLYQSIPVIAAYNTEEEAIQFTMFRPWIFHEAQTYRDNPFKVTYVGDLTDWKYSCWERDIKFQFRQAWRGSFVQTILGVLCHELGMTSISDFKFIIPQHAQLLATAYAKMSREDYLLTAAILCQIDRPHVGSFPYHAETMSYSLYSFAITDRVIERPTSRLNTYSPSRPPKDVYGIFLNQVKTGQWIRRPRMGSHNKYDFAVLPKAELAILTPLACPSPNAGILTVQKEAWRPPPDMESLIANKLEFVEVNMGKKA